MGTGSSSFGDAEGAAVVFLLADIDYFGFTIIIDGGDVNDDP